MTGAKAAHAAEPQELTAYEIPLRADDDLITAYDVTGILRTLHTGTHTHPSARVGSVMGMILVHVDPATVKAAAPTPDDNALSILRTLTQPYTEDQPKPRLRGFLFMDQDKLRLYLDSEDTTGVIAADVRPSGATTALLAAHSRT